MVSEKRVSEKPGCNIKRHFMNFLKISLYSIQRPTINVVTYITNLKNKNQHYSVKPIVTALVLDESQ